jgi:hypothetical protein
MTGELPILMSYIPGYPVIPAPGSEFTESMT